MNRRGFIGAIIGAAAAPAIVRASSLMPIKAAGYSWKTVAGGFVVPVNFSELIAKAFNDNRQQIIENVTANNALLLRLMNKDLYADVGITRYHTGKSPSLLRFQQE